MSVLVDAARYPAHGRLWAHLTSDTSLAELHAFAALLGVPARSFEGDHYDVPAESVPAALALGAQPVSTRELLLRLRAAGLRTPKRRGEKVLTTSATASHGVGAGRVDVVRAAHLPPPFGTHVVLRLDAGVPALAEVRGAPGDAPHPGYRVLGFRRRWSRRDGATRVEHDGLLLDEAAAALPRSVFATLLDAPGEHWWAPLLSDGPPRT